MIYVVQHQSIGDCVRSYSGQTEDEVRALLDEMGASYEVVDQAAYDAKLAEIEAKRTAR